MQDLVINQFSDPDQATDRLRPSDNPYAAPADSRRGLYDHWLFWRIVKFCGVMLLILLILDAAILVGYLDRFEQQGSIWTSIQEFFTDWDAAKVPH